ncbi:MAG: SUMF1/EgtB/PvdO family nonheme iron enzyme [Candidatus Aegiribacteria sp.]|nr:SUMF1/EgtB/PvdO family nonheme iron enzyme [Candidatus Aegiribacteria sp.]
MSKRHPGYVLVYPISLFLFCAGTACMGPHVVESYHFTPRSAEFRDQVYDRESEFRSLDINDDDFLSPEEYNGTAELFHEMDSDGNGLLNHEETEYMITLTEIPTGSFTMGTDIPIRAFFEPATDASPAHEVAIDSFRMSATEITTAQYVLYLNSALGAGEITVRLGDVSDEQTRVFYPVPAYVVEGAPGTEFAGNPYTHLSPITALSHIRAENSPLLIPEHPLNQSWIRFSPELQRFYVHPGFEDWPAAFVKWWGAMAFAEYYGLSLPTEAEWEYAARGGNQFDFPTSDGTNGGQRSNYKCYNVMGVPNFEGADTPDEYVGFRLTVGSYLPNPYGLYDLAGNVWEWNLDWYDEDYYQYCVDNGITRNPLNTAGEEAPMDGSAMGGPGQVFTHDARVCRGGSYNYHEAVTRTAYRFPVYSFIANDHFGFRVVLRPSSVVFNTTD